MWISFWLYRCNVNVINTPDNTVKTYSNGLDYGLFNHLPERSFDGYSAGVAVVQHLDEYGTEIYAQFRRYSLDQDGVPNPKAINGGTLGARVKF